MENKMLMPANYSAMAEEELTYTTGGSVGGVLGSVTYLAAGALYVYNYAWGLNQTRNWLKKNKTGNVFKTAAKAADAGMDYVSASLINSVRGVITAMQFTTLWPITAVAWLTV